MLLTGSLGAVFIMLALYADIFAFERRAYIVEWFAGWTVIALNYVVDVFFPDLLRGKQAGFSDQHRLLFLRQLSDLLRQPQLSGDQKP